jgi:hypothetical protein
MCICSGFEARRSFLKKRTKKLLAVGGRASQAARAESQTFFASFLQKRRPC